MIDRSQWINTVASLYFGWDISEVRSTYFSLIPSRTEPQRPTATTCSLTQLGRLPSLSASHLYSPTNVPRGHLPDKSPASISLSQSLFLVNLT